MPDDQANRIPPQDTLWLDVETKLPQALEAHSVGTLDESNAEVRASGAGVAPPRPSRVSG